MLLPLLEDIVNGLWRRISLPKLPAVVRLTKLVIEAGEGRVDLFLLGILSPDCAADIVQVEVERVVLQRFLVENAAQDALYPSFRLECAIITLKLSQQPLCKGDTVNWLVPNRSSNSQLTATNSAAVRHLGHGGSQAHWL